MTDPSDLASALIRDAHRHMPVGSWGLPDWQFDLATRSAVFRELVRPVPGEDVDQGELIALDRIWRAGGSPADKTPRIVVAEWDRMADGDPSLAFEWEDRGDAGLYGDLYASAWVASMLDPDVIGGDVIANWLY